MLSCDPAFDFMQYLDHLTFLKYLMRVEHEGGRNENGRRSIFDVIETMKIMCELMKSTSNALDPTLCFTQFPKHIQFLEYLMGVEHERGRTTGGIR